MTVTGISKSMQTRTYFAIWRQKLLNVYPIFTGTSYLYSFLDFYVFAAYTFYRNMCNRDDRLPV